MSLSRSSLVLFCLSAALSAACGGISVSRRNVGDGGGNETGVSRDEAGSGDPASSGASASSNDGGRSAGAETDTPDKHTGFGGSAGSGASVPSNDGGRSAGVETDTPDKHTGFGELAGSAGSSGMGGSGSTECVTAGGSGSVCPEPAYVGQPILMQLDVPGVGRMWPRPAQLGGEGGGANGTGADDSGCTTESEPWGSRLAVTCHGLAELAWLDADESELGRLQVAYGDGSVARVLVDETPGVARAEMDVSVWTYYNVDGGTSDMQEVSGRTTNGAELWISEHDMTLEDAAQLFGARVTEVESCPAEHVFDHVVHTVPEQRISAGRVATVRAALGNYRVAWDLSRPEPSVCNPTPYGRNGFSAALAGQ